MGRISITLRRHATTGLLAAQSDELRPLLVVGHTLDELLERLPRNIEDVMRVAQGKLVRVTGIELAPGTAGGWVDYDLHRAVATYELAAA